MSGVIVALAQADPLPDAAGGTRAVVGLIVVLGLLLGLAWLARQGRLRLPGSARGRAAVSVEAAVPLGDRRSLVIVSVEGRRLLLGLTPAQVSLVTELAPPTFQQAVDRHLPVATGPS